MYCKTAQPIPAQGSGEKEKVNPLQSSAKKRFRIKRHTTGVFQLPEFAVDHYTWSGLIFWMNRHLRLSGIAGASGIMVADRGTRRVVLMDCYPEIGVDLDGDVEQVEEDARIQGVNFFKVLDNGLSNRRIRVRRKS